jgi:aspartate 1-decarboxylase
MKNFVGSKIHGIRVTRKSVDYNGSVSICPRLMAASNIEPYEQVHIINLNNGNRWVTYAIQGGNAEFCLNGGGARLGEIGDVCVVLTYVLLDKFSSALVIFCREGNDIASEITYKNRDLYKF